MLQDVVNSGTAGRLRWQFGLTDMEIGGKTGTSNKNRDAWFMCVTPKLVTGAWVGGEDQSVHFIRGGEGSVMALPIVGEYMKKIYDDGRFGHQPYGPVRASGDDAPLRLRGRSRLRGAEQPRGREFLRLTRTGFSVSDKSPGRPQWAARTYLRIEPVSLIRPG